MKDGTIVFGDDTAKHEVSASLSWSAEPTPVRAELQYDGLVYGCHNHKTFRLQDLDPDSLAFSEAAKAKGGYGFSVLTTNREKVVFMEKSGSECKENGERSSDFYVGNFWYTTATDRDKAAEAMKKAILLAGGKPSAPKPQVAAAPSAPTTNPAIAEAGNFIVSKVNGLAWRAFSQVEFGDGSRGQNTYFWFSESFTISGCKGTYGLRVEQSVLNTETKTWSPREAWLENKDVTFDASTLVMTSAKIGEFTQQNYETPKDFAIQIPARPHNVLLLIPDEETAHRVFNAFKGLAKACGAKDEAY